MCTKGESKMYRSKNGPRTMDHQTGSRIGEVWRPSPPWTGETLKKLKDEVRHTTPPPTSRVPHMNVLLVGRVGAGKSSFFNTVSSIFQGRLSGQAASGPSDTSLTDTFRPYKVRDVESNNEFLKFRLCDTRGIEDSIHEDEFRLILNGNITDGYKFGSAKTYRRSIWGRLGSSIFSWMSYFVAKIRRQELSLPMVDETPKASHKQSRGFQSVPTPADQMHCVCFILDGGQIDVLDDLAIANIKKYKTICTNKGIPFMVMLTKPDMVCCDVKKQLTIIFNSTTVHKVVEKTAEILSLQERDILLVKNYHNEVVLKDDTLSKSKADVRDVTPPSTSRVPCVNVLVVGQIGAGKSSFFNTISSIFKNHLSEQATSGPSDTSLTDTFRPYKVRDAESNNEFLKFRLCDTRGIEDSVQEDEFKLILNGNITDGYKFGSAKTIRRSIWDKMRDSVSSWMNFVIVKVFGQQRTLPMVDIQSMSSRNGPRGFQRVPKLADQMHCVCFVLDGGKVDLLDKPAITNIKRYQRICSDKGVPFLVMLTKPDIVCAEVSRQVSTIFNSAAVLKVVEKTAEILEIQEKEVLPVKNYHNEGDLIDDISILALMALKRMLGRALDFLQEKHDYEQKDEQSTDEFTVVMPDDS